MKQGIEVSRGETLVEEAETIRDKIGTMSKVRSELTELFEFIKNDFKDESGVELTLVLFIDDLDRVLGGRNVKMLEAIQLLLNVPGAPVIVFLAIDSRIVVASIEKHINNSMKIEDALITGWEYLEKIVQIPFCIPEISHERVQNYLTTILIKPVAIEELKKSLTDFKRSCENLMEKLRRQFPDETLWCKFPSLQSDFRGNHRIPVKKLLNALNQVDPVFVLGDILKCPNLMLAKSYDKEETEKLCGEISSTLENTVFLKSQEPDNLQSEANVPQQQHNQTQNNNTTSDSEGTERDDLDPLNFKVDSENDSVITIPFAFKKEEADILPGYMVKMFRSISTKVECNPRSIKSLTNLFQIVFEIAKDKPMTEFPLTKIARWNGGKDWELFSKKVVIWLVMAHNFTYRLSALVQVLLDFEQKREFNAKNPSDFKYKSCRVDATVEAKKDNKVDNVDDMSVLDFYQNYVEKFIHVFRNSERLSRVDKDPEEFALLLLECNSVGMKCQDIFGPRITTNASDAEEGDRRMEFSLLSYSFNLDPAMRLEIGDDMACLISEHEMFKGDKVVALHKGSIVRKKDFLNNSMSNHGILVNKVNRSSTDEAEKVSKSTNVDEKIVTSFLLGIPSDKEKNIVDWLREQHILSMILLRNIEPLSQCPSDWPLGWKLALDQIIQQSKKVAINWSCDREVEIVTYTWKNSRCSPSMPDIEAALRDELFRKALLRDDHVVQYVEIQVSAELHDNLLQHTDGRVFLQNKLEKNGLKCEIETSARNPLETDRFLKISLERRL
mmetsp:Transcript_26544/g.36506  ORF Transcript_26544/g.36506 Transcript_26544/m.36506 type:complete len:783 (-) Transcript_26544:157-2505(-)